MLSTLPPELLLQVFKSLDSFEAIAALKKTNRTFAAVWKNNSRSIVVAGVDNFSAVAGTNNNDFEAFQALANPTQSCCLNPWVMLGSDE